MSSAMPSRTDLVNAEVGIGAVSDASLSPLAFLTRSAEVWADRPAIIDGSRAFTYAEHHARVRRLAGALRAGLGIGAGDRVAALLPNVTAMLELHYAIPGAGGVLVPLNTRLAAAEYAYILEHSGARAVVASTALRSQVEDALAELPGGGPVVVWVDPVGGACEYEQLIDAATPIDLLMPDDERALLSINYTSGTTGRPKGVMTSHRGAYLHSLGVIAEAGLSTRSAYLWTLPMFHCNGWAYTWAVTAAGARHLCLPVDRARRDLARDRRRRRDAHVRRAHGCHDDARRGVGDHVPEPVKLFVGGAPPAPALLERAAALRLEVTHLYGLTETYGPLAVCAWNPDWDARLPRSGRACARVRA